MVKKPWSTPFMHAFPKVLASVVSFTKESRSASQVSATNSTKGDHQRYIWCAAWRRVEHGTGGCWKQWNIWSRTRATKRTMGYSCSWLSCLVHQQASGHIRDHMISPIWAKANLGSPPARYTTNANESSNFVIKKWVGFTKSTGLPLLISYKIWLKLKAWDCACCFWIRRIRSCSFSLISPTKSYLSQYEHLRKIVHHYHQLAKDAPQYLVESHQSISVSACDVQLATVSRATLENIWGKAEKILNLLGCTVPAPGSKNSAYIVASETSARPHFVHLNRSGKVVCIMYYVEGHSCIMWRGCQLCSNTIAAAEKEQSLPKFIDWLHKSRPECSLTKLLTTPKEKSAGTKAGKEA